ncbi:MAG TPA: long-chain fatty acid--CoA ligase [Deltaproteobacteria bacterium]|nr:long-chain fatty acid--CoA ligase [Deltaproteobacteria bacterium]
MDTKTILDNLTGPGAPFEMVEEEVRGVPMRVLADRPRSLGELVERSRDHDGKEFIVSGERRIRFDDHRAAVADIAAALESGYGIGPGDRVALFGANSPEWILSFWAIVSLGAVAVGMNGWWAAEEAEYALGDSDPKLLIGDRKRLARIQGRSFPFPVLEMESQVQDFVTGKDAALPRAEVDEDDPACILYTSGTTGRPKGAVLSHRAVIACVGLQTLNGAAMFLASGATSPPGPTCTLLTTPLFHVSGLLTGAVMMLATGAKIVLHEGRFDPVEIMRLIEREKVTSWGAMSTMAHRVVNDPRFAEFDLSSLRNLGSGGAPMSRELQRQIREALPAVRDMMAIGYGLTECGGIATINVGAEFERHPDSVGRPMPGVEVEVRDASGRPLPEGEEGEIHVRSPLLMSEYWRNPEATREAILPGRWLKTGDIGRFEAGRLYINSRARDLILRGGENIYPIEIEQALEASPLIAEAAVLGVDHPELGQEVMAVIVPEAGAAPTEEVLREWLTGRIAPFKIPSRWCFRKTPLPRNATGKVMKGLLLDEAPNPLLDE